jgi:signal transduction histidine kinase/tetratricopeptide (TPR) repeat protein
MKKILFLSLLLMTNFVFSQNAQDIINRLKKDLLTNPDDKKKATIYSDLTWYYSNISIDSSFFYGEKALFESKKINDSTIIAQVYSDIAMLYYKKSDYQKSNENYLKAYTIRKARNDVKGMAKINANLGNIYQVQGKLKLAMQTYLNAYEYFSKINDLKQLSIIKGNIGALYYELKDYSKALKYINEVITYSEENNLKEPLCRNYLTKGNILLSMNDTIASVKAYNKSLFFCNEVGDLFTISKSNNNLAIIKQAQNKTEDSKKLFAKVAEQRKTFNSDGAYNKNRLNEAYTLLKENKFEEAKNILLEINNFFIEKKLDFELSNSYKYLVPIYARLNKPDSVIHYQSLYEQSIEKATKLATVKETAELETKYQTEKKEKQIIKQQADAKQKNTYLVSLSILVVFLGLIGYLVYRQQKLKNVQQEQEFKLKSAISKIETQNKLQEQRLSISRDLHDNIGAQLTFIISSVDSVKYGFDITNEKLDNKLTHISSFARETILELRDTIWAMNSNEISFEDLEGRIHNFIEKAKEAKQEITFSFYVDTDLKTKKLSSVEGMNVYRTIQEAINNSLKYAKATSIKIEVVKENSQTKIIISDDGIGFNETEINYGNGLNNMKKRIEEIGGKLSISSSEKGTSIEALI